MGEMNEFLKALQQNDEIKELLKNQPKPGSDEEAAETYASIAEKMGFKLSREDMINGLKGLEKIQMEKTDASLKQVLDEADLEQVAGGGEDPRCSDTFSPGEWCWFTDSCSFIIRGYDDAAAPQVNVPQAQPEIAQSVPGYPADAQDELAAFDACNMAAAKEWEKDHP